MDHLTESLIAKLYDKGVLTAADLGEIRADAMIRREDAKPKPKPTAAPIFVDVQRMYRFETDRPLKAFADITVNDAILIKGVRVMEGKDGLFVAMPREQASDERWYDTVRCLTDEVKNKITDRVLTVYSED